MKNYDPLEMINSFYQNTNLINEQYEVLFELSLDPNYEVRLRLCELLGKSPSKHNEKILLQLINDNDYIVRASACDSLSWSDSSLVLNALSKAMKDPVELVRGYAVLSFADVQRNMPTYSRQSIKILKDLLIKEKNNWVRIAIYRSLILLGETKFLDDFLSQIYDKRYENRCFFLNLLEELTSNNIIEITDSFFKHLQHIYENEKALSVKSSLHNLISKHKKTGNSSVIDK